jgi:cytochrome bd ubiquinol oxidase subunit II
MTHEMLQTLWFVLIAVLWIGFYFLEGFDFGVGMLLTTLGKKDEERRAIINAIGPTWDGNEVWLIAAGGAMFAAFPMWYATLFSGFYLALFLLLVGLIIRGIAFEYRSKDPSPRWRHTFDWMISIGSFMCALLLGVAFANLAKGVPIDADMNIVSSNSLVTVINLLNPYGILGGLATVTVFLVHGANFLSLKLDGDLRGRAHALSEKLWIAAVVAVILFTVATYFYTDVLTKLGVNPGVTPILAVVALLATGFFIRAKQEGWAFIMTSLQIVLTMVTFFLLMFPRVMISSLNPAWSLTIYNSSSSPYTLTIMSFIALIFIPIILVYQGWTYWMFRKRVTTDTKTLTY